ncbi:443_t:CDS:2 [Ambispora gerdemannii]|uniref:443_t:CDS:1 n=1 Tax=Ambispora gerdemannii TaxID=144530 RepID=A0A9N8WG23_9GLOM|nr:443_t:CDS:2 [Ambispora gerdemannii]
MSNFATAVIKNIQEGPTKGIITHGWTITSTKLPILNAKEIERAQAELEIPLPEMFFGNNRITISNEHGFEFEFSPMEALKHVDASREGGDKVKLAYSEEWKKKSEKNHEHVKDVVKSYDWTYSTTYRCTLKSAPDGQNFKPTTDRIDIEKLKLPEPINFYDENILFEDELADNGTAMLNAKMRVMPSGFFVLQRFFLRVDDVLFRLNETRVYHEFGTVYLIREYSSREEAYDKIRAAILPHRGDDISQLTDPDWVSSKLPAPLEQIIEKINVIPEQPK